MMPRPRAMPGCRPRRAPARRSGELKRRNQRRGDDEGEADQEMRDAEAVATWLEPRDSRQFTAAVVP